jgi:serine/threonine-protein kinase
MDDDDDGAALAPTRERPEFKTLNNADTSPNPIVPPRRDELIDTTISGYQVEGILGRGAAGIVYRAQHLTSGRKAAFKVLKPEFAEEPEYIRRMVDEARALTSIRHPGIIDILDFGTLPNGQPYLVMELCDGLSLEEQLKYGGQPTLHETLALLDELFDALGAAHARGVIHRDVKPSNLFLATFPDGSRRLKVLDFGLARRGDTQKSILPTRPGTMVGTPDYMPPEQVKGQKMGPASDVYAVGGVAFRLLTNRLPFVGPSGIAVINKKMDGPPPHPRDIDPKIAPVLDALIFEMLAPNPKNRPSLKDARAGFAAYAASLRRGPIPSLLDEDPSTGPTAFHDFKEDHSTIKEAVPKPAPAAKTEPSIRAPFASPPTRPTDLELPVAHIGPGTSAALQAIGRNPGSNRWWIPVALLIAGALGIGAWLAFHH